MKREKYIYNDQTLQYEKLVISNSTKLLKGSLYLLSIIILSGVLFLLSNTYIPTPKEKTLEKEINQMETHFAAITNEFDDLATDLEDLKQKDNEVHRMIFGMAPMDENLWEGGIGGHDKYKYITKYSNSSELLKSTSERVEKLKYKLALQRRSLDTIYSLAVEREEKLASIPSIKPIPEDKLKRKFSYLSGFGKRLHPIHKVLKFHGGIDFTAEIGTPIQATGNGKVIKVEKKKRGYGKNIIIDHGFGYKTRYAHMDEMHVKVGESVTKGQQIGTVGNTGTSTAPHLHYEVILNGKRVDPVDYCLDGLTTEEYHELVLKASQENQAFDDH